MTSLYLPCLGLNTVFPATYPQLASQYSSLKTQISARLYFLTWFGHVPVTESFAFLTYCDSDVIFQFFCSLFVVTRYDVDGLPPVKFSTQSSPISLAEI